MCPYTLIQDGDGLEKVYYPLFISREFPSYEAFWQKYVVPLTNRPTDIHFKTDPALAAIGKTHNDICIAQLNYSILTHLARAFNIKRIPNVGTDLLMEGIVRICGAQDVAFDLLERFTNPANYGAWVAKSTTIPKGSKEARSTWQKNHGYPLQQIRDYRNNLIHGRMLPRVIGNAFYLPDIGKENQYFDWRRITNNPALQTTMTNDFKTTNIILNHCWDVTLAYLEAEWLKIV